MDRRRKGDREKTNRKKLLEQGMEPEKIAEITSLTIEHIYAMEELK